MIDMAFEFITQDEDPITQENLASMVEAAKARLDRILAEQCLEAFDVCDTSEVDSKQI